MTEAKCTGGFKGKRRARNHVSFESQLERNLSFSFDVREHRVFARISVGVPLLQVTCNFEIANPGADLRCASAIGVGIDPRGVEIEGVAQMPVNERMLAGDLGTGATCHLTSNAQRFN